MQWMTRTALPASAGAPHRTRRRWSDEDGSVSEIPDLGLLPQRIIVEAEQVRRLISDQFPELADLPIAPVANSGWDNWTLQSRPRQAGATAQRCRVRLSS